jgi:predicted transcriptional regulator
MRCVPDTSDMRALSIRQPFAELILRGIKTAELRSISTRIIGERFFIYASKSKSKAIWSNDLLVAKPPQWMIELAEQVGMIDEDAMGGLPTGVIVGSAVIERVSRVDELYRWHLVDVQRATKFRKPTRQPQPDWFVPF